MSSVISDVNLVTYEIYTVIRAILMPLQFIVSSSSANSITSEQNSNQQKPVVSLNAVYARVTDSAPSSLFAGPHVMATSKSSGKPPGGTATPPTRMASRPPSGRPTRATWTP